MVCDLCKDFRYCPACETWKEKSDFGICRARPDGLNLYCKPCIRSKITRSRQALREYKKSRIKRPQKTSTPIVQQPARPPVVTQRRIAASARTIRKLPAVDRVREAIRHGAHTQKEIVHVTKLRTDEVGEHIADLLLWKREIRTVLNGKRLYFINEGGELPEHTFPPPREPRSFGVSSVYSGGEPEKLSKVAR